MERLLTFGIHSIYTFPLIGYHLFLKEKGYVIDIEILKYTSQGYSQFKRMGESER